MKILVDADFIGWGVKHITPFYKENVNPASLDLTLGNAWIDLYDESMHTGPVTLYPSSRFREMLYEIKKAVHRLLFQPVPQHKPTSILAITEEWIDLSDNMAADIKLKTTPARKGLNHTLAGWIDPGYEGRLTLTLHATQTVTLVPGQRVCQIIVYQLDDVPVRSYRKTGHYMYQTRPTPAKEMSNG